MRRTDYGSNSSTSDIVTAASPTRGRGFFLCGFRGERFSGREVFAGQVGFRGVFPTGSFRERGFRRASGFSGSLPEVVFRGGFRMGLAFRVDIFSYMIFRFFACHLSQAFNAAPPALLPTIRAAFPLCRLSPLRLSPSPHTSCGGGFPATTCISPTFYGGGFPAIARILFLISSPLFPPSSSPRKPFAAAGTAVGTAAGTATAGGRDNPCPGPVLLYFIETMSNFLLKHIPVPAVCHYVTPVALVRHSSAVVVASSSTFRMPAARVVSVVPVASASRRDPFFPTGRGVAAPGLPYVPFLRPYMSSR